MVKVTCHHTCTHRHKPHKSLSQMHEYTHTCTCTHTHTHNRDYIPKIFAMAMLSRKPISGATRIPQPRSCEDVGVRQMRGKPCRHQLTMWSAYCPPHCVRLFRSGEQGLQVCMGSRSGSKWCVYNVYRHCLIINKKFFKSQAPAKSSIS